MVPSCKMASRASVLTLALLPLVGVPPNPVERTKNLCGYAFLAGRFFTEQQVWSKEFFCKSILKSALISR